MSAPVHGPLELTEPNPRCDRTFYDAVEHARASEATIVAWRRAGARLDDPIVVAAQDAYTSHLRRVTELVRSFIALGGGRCPFCREARAS
jgi:hypothetical protein